MATTAATSANSHDTHDSHDSYNRHNGHDGYSGYDDHTSNKYVLNRSQDGPNGPKSGSAVCAAAKARLQYPKSADESMYSLNMDFVAVKGTMDYMVRALHGNEVQVKELYGEEKRLWGNYMARRLHGEGTTWLGGYMVKGLHGEGKKS